MSKSIQAAIWSGLIFPGAGHLYLKCYVRGAILVGVSTVCLIIILSQAFEQALAAAHKIVADGGGLDLGRIMGMATQISASLTGQSMGNATLVLIACWVLGLLDAYRVGLKHF